MIQYVKDRSTVQNRKMIANQPIIMCFTNDAAPATMYAEVAGITFTAYNREGYYTFDFTEIVRRQFANNKPYVKQTILDTYELEPLNLYGIDSLFVGVTLPSMEQGTDTLSYYGYTFVNGVIKDDFAAEPASGKLLGVYSNHITKYAGMPMYVIVNTETTDTLQIGLDGYAVTYSFVDLKRGVFAISIGEDMQFMKYNGNTYRFHVSDDYTEGALYLRWINADGAYSYYMFKCKQNRTTAVENVKLAVVSRYSIYDSNIREIGKEISKSITVKSEEELLPIYKDLAFIAQSACVEMYIKAKDMWQTIYPKAFSNSIAQRDISGSIEITFEVPTQLQQAYMKV